MHRVARGNESGADPLDVAQLVLERTEDATKSQIAPATEVATR